MARMTEAGDLWTPGTGEGVAGIQMSSAWGWHMPGRGSGARLSAYTPGRPVSMATGPPMTSPNHLHYGYYYD